jgi:hypothetical protein
MIGEEKEVVAVVEVEAVVGEVEMVQTVEMIEIICKAPIKAKWQEMMANLKKAR